MKKFVCILLFIFLSQILFSFSFSGDWRAKLIPELSIEETITFADVQFDIERRIVELDGEEYTFEIKNTVLLFGDSIYEYATKDDYMIVLYRYNEYSKYDKIIFIRH